MRRVDCPRCEAAAVEEVPWGDGKRSLIKAYMLFPARWARKLFDAVTVRAGESRRMALEGLAPVLKKSRWLLLKRDENLKTEQRFRLRDLLRYPEDRPRGLRSCSLAALPEPESSHDFF
ncbi:MAG: transposase [Bryobacteraceae bacterium]